MHRYADTMATAIFLATPDFRYDAVSDVSQISSNVVSIPTCACCGTQYSTCYGEQMASAMLNRMIVVKDRLGSSYQSPAT